MDAQDLCKVGVVHITLREGPLCVIMWSFLWEGYYFVEAANILEVVWWKSI